MFVVSMINLMLLLVVMIINETMLLVVVESGWVMLKINPMLLFVIRR
jgi:hypothetical protein